MQIAIGTANFGDKYGLLKNKFDKKKIKELDNLIKKNKIKYLDTALVYKNSEKIIKRLSLKNIKIITKVKLPKKSEENYINNLEKKILKNIEILKINCFEFILLQNIEDLKSKYFTSLLDKINLLKKKKLIRKIGISVYSPDDMNLVYSKFSPKLVQISINVFDTRFVRSKWLKTLKKKKVIVQVRSVFLQGLLLKKNIELKNKKVSKFLLSKHKKYENWLNKKKISKLEFCINFIKRLKYLDIVTFGINDISQLNQIVQCMKSNKKIINKNFSINKYKAIDPRYWS
jgi:aryl-alcohol dehydrogenase-like predicted oxidoreductase